MSFHSMNFRAHSLTNELCRYENGIDTRFSRSASEKNLIKV